ncbi:diacylglycerol/lipid kinase family protein [Allorhizobium undicola]|uniref:diacylglycerol/lipid kinase family protein n=1 Tax=Allorhizobium undicola TaxID=78527 RepID=UPI0006888D92|nr:diacylglycerol kinase family protein [Allorhizobium undicola]
MALVVVKNPVAGGGRSAALWNACRGRIGELFPDHRIVETLPGQMAEQVRTAVEADGDRVLVLGGDGTIGAAAHGILCSSRPHTPLSFLACGTGCDFARNYQWPGAPEECLEALASATPGLVDVIRLEVWREGQWWLLTHALNIASVGVSGAIIARMAGRGSLIDRLPPTLRYRLHCIFGIVAYRSRRVEIRVDGSVLADGPILVATVCNGGWFGSGLHVHPQTRPDDGLLDVVAAGCGGVAGNLAMFAAFDRGTHLVHPRVAYGRGTVVEIAPAADRQNEHAFLEADGEPYRGDRLRLTVLPGALTVALPPLMS